MSYEINSCLTRSIHSIVLEPRVSRFITFYFFVGQQMFVFIIRPYELSLIQNQLTLFDILLFPVSIQSGFPC
jgi:hypothetical protein